jgi:hypothetical protein
MERLHTKQQNVLKRKVEEAAAVNKRLKMLWLYRKVSRKDGFSSMGQQQRFSCGLIKNWKC